jgi:ribonuclease-3
LNRVFIEKFSLRFPRNRVLFKNIYAITGFLPKNTKVYKQAFVHNSKSVNLFGDKGDTGNERLEFLGDAVLGMVVAEFLFKKYPFESEGFLTEVRSKIVCRKSLSKLATDMGLTHHLFFDKSISENRIAVNTIAGNALEALIGAVYLDLGYVKARKFILKKIIRPFINLDELIDQVDNYKSVLNQWCQKNKKDLHFTIENETGKNHYKIYTICANIDGEKIGLGRGNSKKIAEQLASEDACKKLAIADFSE